MNGWQPMRHNKIGSIDKIIKMFYSILSEFV